MKVTQILFVRQLSVAGFAQPDTQPPASQNQFELSLGSTFLTLNCVLGHQLLCFCFRHCFDRG